MRADRLLSLLMLLQSKGLMTASDLSKELEVTERTIYRDVVALSTAGIPVYTTKGPGGGIGLVEEYRNNLNTLKPDEVRALFMLEIPPVLEQLGVGGTVRKALLKLSSSLPGKSRLEKKEQQTKIMLDPYDWHQREELLPWLKTCQDALNRNRMLDMVYRSDFNATLEMQVAPLGLVAKSQRWYLVVLRGEHFRTLQVSRIQNAKISNKLFEVPSDFNLAAYWKEWCLDRENDHPVFRVRAKVTRMLANILEQNRPITLMAPPMVGDIQWVEIDLEYESFEEARRMILGYGGAIEILEPLSLRKSVQDFASRTVSIYQKH
ncbi:MAG TPA: WYL domain-containing protein [Anaerolineaceae bacterium]|nr:WYL domain-containing protein [Anaerolineaceae bacterium]